jgi:hypothetical protein
VWPQYWDLYEPRGPAKGPKGVKSHPTKKNAYFFININLYNCSCNCIYIVFILCSVFFIVCVVLCAVFCLSVVCYFV